VKAVRVHAVGGPEALQLEDVATPEPGPGEVLIEVAAVGVNFIDVYHRAGLYKVAMPFTPGQEAAGTVTALGPGVGGVRRGDRVACYHGSLAAYAEYVVAPADRVVVLPDGVTPAQGAALMLQGMTAHYLACTTHPIRPGETCVVHAAAGGVGLLLCQIAKRRGARVIGTVSTTAKADLAREAGADEVIDYTAQDFSVAVMRLTGGAGAQVIYDSVGSTTFDAGLRCLARRGMMVLFGQSSGPVAPLDPQVLNQRGSLFLTRPTLGHYVATRAELESRARELLRWVRDGTLKLHIDRTWPLAQAGDAHRALEHRTTSGKVLLQP
jgi:NADPH:quinone reductase